MIFRSGQSALPILMGILATSFAAAQTLSSDAPGATTPAYAATSRYYGQQLSQADVQGLLSALAAARAGDGYRVRAAMAGLSDPVARKIALWALIDSAPETVTFQEADAARRDLADWPRPIKRQIAGERSIERSGLPPAAVVAWFNGAAPQSAEGAMALASALRASGDTAGASALIKQTWRTQVFDQDVQQAMLARFGAWLDQSDHIARADLLLYGTQGAAAQDIVRLLPADQQAIAQARMAVRRGDRAAQSLIDALPLPAQNSPGLVYERVLRMVDSGDTAAALPLVGYLPTDNPNEAAAERLWKHGTLVVTALRSGSPLAAYAAAAHAGMTAGPKAGEAEFYAGWIALSKLKDPKLADVHFARLQGVGQSPLTQSRALYWRGRAAEALGDPVAAQIFYGQAARFNTTFYGQLAAIRGGATTLVLGADPPVTPADRARFDARDSTRAARIFYQLGSRDGFKGFVAGLSEVLPSAMEEALLVDLARGYGDQEISMRVVRNAARRGFILPERGYPIRLPPSTPGAPEAAFVLGVTRQESSFDPQARSGAGARGMMQLMPATAQMTARRLGLGAGSLDDADYNMRVGSAYLGELVGQFSGSYVMAAAAYNAGPGRPNQWVTFCGDPRGTATDPLDFIECIPFSETRDYVMRVLEATQVYRARLNGGAAPITLAADLKRGGYGAAMGSMAGVQPPPPERPPGG